MDSHRDTSIHRANEIGLEEEEEVEEEEKRGKLVHDCISGQTTSGDLAWRVSGRVTRRFLP